MAHLRAFERGDSVLVSESCPVMAEQVPSRCPITIKFFRATPPSP